MQKIFICGETEFVDDERQCFIVTISIFNEKVLPLEIFGNEVHFYTAKGCGASGSRDAFYVLVSKDENGEVTAEESSASRLKLRANNDGL